MLHICPNGLVTWRTIIGWVSIYKMESNKKQGGAPLFLALACSQCLQVEQMLVLVAPVCSRFSQPKARGCLSRRTICKPSVRIYPRKSPFFLLVSCSSTKAFQTGQLENPLIPDSPPNGDLTDISIIFTY